MYKELCCKYKPLDFYGRECEDLKQSKCKLASVIRDESGNECELLYGVSYDIARCGESHMISENIVKPCDRDTAPLCLAINS
jgi:hypothetical protein